MAIKKIIKARKVATITSVTAFNCAIDEIAEKSVRYNQLLAEAQAAHQKVDDELQPGLKALEAEIYDLRDAAEPFFMAHMKDLLKPGQREGETALATFGIRTGMPQVVKRVKTAFKTLANQMAIDEVFARFVRSTNDINKDAVIAAFRDNDATDTQRELRRIGLDVEQRDEFWIKAKAEAQV